jgi:hypothetical protein
MKCSSHRVCKTAQTAPKIVTPFFGLRLGAFAFSPSSASGVVFRKAVKRTASRAWPVFHITTPRFSLRSVGPRMSIATLKL